MKKILPLIILFLTGFSTIAQESADKNKIDPYANIEGTYQFEMINTRNQPYIPGNLKEIILEKRDPNKIVYVQLGTEVRLKIMPLIEIKKADYKPLPIIIYITE
ncbi:MAG: hypothetical protein V4548_07195 [Bacteroidota bacterium]